MEYEGVVYRPPSEANSLILQATIGCARNTCRFCSMYKGRRFRAKTAGQIISELQQMRALCRFPVRRIFLADGDALILKTDTLRSVLLAIRQIFPESERVSAYGAPQDILGKTPDELKMLRSLGLTLVYTGIESGSDAVLKAIDKRVTAAEMIESGLRLKECGIQQSVTFISGLGGASLMEEHAIESARVLSAIKPAYASCLTLLVEPEAPLYDDVAAGRFQLLPPEKIVDEMELFLSHVDSEETVFRSNHASNYIALAGNFNRDIPRMLAQLETAKKRCAFKPENWRAL